VDNLTGTLEGVSETKSLCSYTKQHSNELSRHSVDVISADDIIIKLNYYQDSISNH